MGYSVAVARPGDDHALMALDITNGIPSQLLSDCFSATNIQQFSWPRHTILVLLAFTHVGRCWVYKFFVGGTECAVRTCLRRWRFIFGHCMKLREHDYLWPRRAGQHC